MPSKKSTKKPVKKEQKKKAAKKTPEKTKKQKVIDITKHELVPKHELLSDGEKKELLKKLGVGLSDLPKIRINDPAIRHLNPKVGDIVRIIRKSPTAGIYIYYRVVVEE